MKDIKPRFASGGSEQPWPDATFIDSDPDEPPGLRPDDDGAAGGDDDTYRPPMRTTSHQPFSWPQPPALDVTFSGGGRGATSRTLDSTFEPATQPHSTPRLPGAAPSPRRPTDTPIRRRRVAFEDPSQLGPPAMDWSDAEEEMRRRRRHLRDDDAADDAALVPPRGDSSSPDPDGDAPIAEDDDDARDSDPQPLPPSPPLPPRPREPPPPQAPPSSPQDFRGFDSDNHSIYDQTPPPRDTSYRQGYDAAVRRIAEENRLRAAIIQEEARRQELRLLHPLSLSLRPRGPPPPTDLPPIDEDSDEDSDEADEDEEGPEFGPPPRPRQPAVKRSANDRDNAADRGRIKKTKRPAPPSPPLTRSRAKRLRPPATEPDSDEEEVKRRRADILKMSAALRTMTRTNRDAKYWQRIIQDIVSGKLQIDAWGSKLFLGTGPPPRPAFGPPRPLTPPTPPPVGHGQPAPPQPPPPPPPPRGAKGRSPSAPPARDQIPINPPETRCYRDKQASSNGDSSDDDGWLPPPPPHQPADRSSLWPSELRRWRPSNDLQYDSNSDTDYPRGSQAGQPRTKRRGGPPPQ